MVLIAPILLGLGERLIQNYLVWKTIEGIFQLFYALYLMSIDTVGQGGQTCCYMRAVLNTQKDFLNNIVTMVKIVMREAGGRSKKVGTVVLFFFLQKLFFFLRMQTACEIERCSCHWELG